MSDLINRMREQAEDLHVINPTSETVKCLSLGADRIEHLEALIRDVAIPALERLERGSNTRLQARQLARDASEKLHWALQGEA